MNGEPETIYEELPKDSAIPLGATLRTFFSGGRSQTSSGLGSSKDILGETKWARGQPPRPIPVDVVNSDPHETQSRTRIHNNPKVLVINFSSVLSITNKIA
ncbi:hypothetical protein LIER_08075 [Lithospermum erythrorhizon]|uniref:Uncharacterized protein n=1 Tax=Lithospermum erythrorhizon TaxID=34254 RepID=A0AAV3PBW4_LITER